MRNARLDELQAGIKIGGRNINNLRCPNVTTLMADREEELKSLLMRVKEESERASLRVNIKKTKIMASGPFSSVQFSSVTQSCRTLCDPKNCSMPGLPVHHQLPEFTQTHVHRVVMPPSHLILCLTFSFCPQSLPASRSFPMSQLFASGSQRIRASALASVLPMSVQG